MITFLCCFSLGLLVFLHLKTKVGILYLSPCPSFLLMQYSKKVDEVFWQLQTSSEYPANSAVVCMVSAIYFLPFSPQRVTEEPCLLP